MVKNTAGQKIGVQMVSASDGSAFTGSVTVSVTIDAGTQATGSVGSGACTHEGNGYHTYAPAQAETNGTLLAFTFTGTGAVPATVQVFTTGYDPTVANLPANVTQFGGSNGTFASGRPEVNTTHVAGTSQTAGDIIGDTNDIQSRLPAALVSGRIDASVGAMATDVLTSTALAASAVTEIQSGLSTLDAAGVRSAVGLASADLDTQIGTLATASSLATVAGYIDTEVAAIKASRPRPTTCPRARRPRGTSPRPPALPMRSGRKPSPTTRGPLAVRRNSSRRPVPVVTRGPRQYRAATRVVRRATCSGTSRRARRPRRRRSPMPCGTRPCLGTLGRAPLVRRSATF